MSHHQVPGNNELMPSSDCPFIRDLMVVGGAIDTDKHLINHDITSVLLSSYDSHHVVMVSGYLSIYTSKGSWRQGIKGEMTCTVYVA